MIELIRKIEREAARTLSDDGGNSIKLSISLKYCRDVARHILNSAAERETALEAQLAELAREHQAALSEIQTLRSAFTRTEIGRLWSEKPKQRIRSSGRSQ